MNCSATSSLTLRTAGITREFPSHERSSSLPENTPLHSRRASYNLIRRPSIEFSADAIFLKVDLFCSELERRLDWLEKYGNGQIDAGLRRAQETLERVRDSCSHASGELIGAGRRRAKILVETLESHYHGVLTTRETLDQKAQAAMRLMENYLLELEACGRAVKDASGVSDSLRRMNEKVDIARGVVNSGFSKAHQARKSLKDSVDYAIKLAKQQRLICYEDVPHPWRSNPHILRGYRFTESKIECLTSVFNFSNEFVNIWSHAIGLIIVLAIALYFYPNTPTFNISSTGDIFMATIFFFAACKCLVCSTIWHTMSSIAHQTLMERFACIDYTGISLLIAASIMTTEWCAFYCEPVSRWFYLTMTAILGVGGVILPWHPTFNRPDMAWARVAFYVALATTGFAPIVQLSLSRGPMWSYYFYSPIGKSVLVYLAGAIIYASKVPERWLPGRFDYAGGSHNIWHIAVLGGILFHYSAMQVFFSKAFRMAMSECPL